MKAVIFDFDGTLVETMPLHYEAYRRTFAEMGLELSRSDFFDHIGGSARETIPKFLRGRDTTWTLEQIHDRKKQILADMLEEAEVVPLPVAQLLTLLMNRVPMAIASSGSRPGVKTILRRLGWEKYFAAIVTGEDADQGKPSPDLFLVAARRLNTVPTECLVFEDTDDGVAAARAAGMHVIDVRKMTSPRGCA
jgi:HAD superfamily hydrolase (TIGR01509 family)